MRDRLAAASLALADNFSVEIRSEASLQILTLRNRNDPDRFAAIYATGYSWYSLDVDGGYSAIEVDEEATEAEIVELIDLYVSAAKKYLERRYVVSRTLLWGHRLVISTPMGLVTLKRPLLNFSKRPRASSS